MIDFKEKIKKFTSEPGRVFGLIYPYILVVIIGIGFIYLSNLDNIARQNVTPIPPDTTQVTDLPVVEPRTIPPVNIIEVSKSTPELLAQGKENYTTICASCHGEQGLGDGPAGISLNPLPRNFTNKDGWKNGPKLSQIYQTLEAGIPGSGMISYNYLPPVDRIALAHYIRDTFVPDPPVNSEGELMALDQTYSLSQGKEIPAQIPVQKAVDIIVKESSTSIQDISQKLSKIYSNRNVAQIFGKITSNEIKALTTLNSNKSWKQDYQRFINSIVYNVNRNGFINNIFKLSSNDWDLLYSYMNGLF